MSQIIFIVFCYIILFGSIYYLSYSNYSALVKMPFYILCILLITYVTYVVAEYWSEDKSKPNNGTKQLFEIFQRFFIIYGEYILVIIVVFILFLVLYNLFMGLLVFSLSKSLWITLGFIILVLTILKKFVYKTGDDGQFITLLKDLIFYIPCLITDSIDFIKKDYEKTPSTTFILFIIIIIYSIIFFLIPLINTDGGLLIVSGPQNLNMVTRISTDELLILNNLPPTYAYDTNNFVYNDVSFAIPVNNKLYPRDKLTKNLEPFMEGFVGLVQEDTTYNYNWGNKEKDTKKTEDIDIGKMYRQATESATNKSHTLYSMYQALMSLFKPLTLSSPYTYNYGLSFWLYINTFHFKQKSLQTQHIVSFGKKLSLTYDNIANELVILLEDEEVYRSKGILYQRWNHVVINSDDSKLDLFVNNNLVGTYEYIQSSTVDLYDSLVIGSTDNNNFGNVCNFRYYTNILDLSKIKSIYTKYNKKTPPI
jgi:hypothetical protein